MGEPARFLGVDLAWSATNPSGVVALEGDAFPLWLVDGPRTCPDHDGVLEWLEGWGGRRPGSAGRVAIGIDAPLLGLGVARGRRRCDDEVAAAFGRFGASVHGLAACRRPLQRFVRRLPARLGAPDLRPDRAAGPGRPAVREVYPNALQVHLFGLDRLPRGRKLTYKRRRFGSKQEWVVRGLGPFVQACGRVIEARGYVRPDAAWATLVADTPVPAAPARALKALEDRWDAVLCALAVALEQLAPGVMRPYTGGGPAGWRRGYVLAPALGRPPPRRTPGALARRRRAPATSAAVYPASLAAAGGARRGRAPSPPSPPAAGPRGHAWPARPAGRALTPPPAGS